MPWVIPRYKLLYYTIILGENKFIYWVKCLHLWEKKMCGIWQSSYSGHSNPSRSNDLLTGTHSSSNIMLLVQHSCTSSHTFRYVAIPDHPNNLFRYTCHISIILEHWTIKFRDPGSLYTLHACLFERLTPCHIYNHDSSSCTHCLSICSCLSLN